MPKVDIINLILYHTGKADAPETLNGVTPAHAAECVRRACEEQGASFKEWSDGIIRHCVIPPEHPYRKLLKKRKVPQGDPLWVLGAIAYGTHSPWIVFRKIEWDGGKVELPDTLERKWIVKHGTL